jgi:HK97 gp10 family phage protein
MELNGKIDGLKELEKSMRDLGKQYSDPKFAVKALRPALKNSVQPLEMTIRGNTPVDTGELRDSVKTRVRQANKIDKGTLGQDAVMVADVGWHWVKGQSLLKQALAVEFGNKVTQAQPTLRPALFSNAQRIVDSFKTELIASIEKKAKQLANRNKPKVR